MTAWLPQQGYFLLANIQNKRTWSQSVTRSTIRRPSHCPVSPKRATPKAPRMCKYINTLFATNAKCNRSQWGLYTIHPWDVPCCFVLDWQMSLRSSRIVKTKASDTPFIMYMSAQPLPLEAFGMGIDVTKVTFLSHILSFFIDKMCFYGLI